MYSIWYALFLVVVVLVVSSLSLSLFERTKALSAPSGVVWGRSFVLFHKKIRGFFLSIMFRVSFKSRVLVIGFKVTTYVGEILFLLYLFFRKERRRERGGL